METRDEFTVASEEQTEQDAEISVCDTLTRDRSTHSLVCSWL